MKTSLAAFFSGVVFALGLGIGGMTQPAKIVGFLDFTGDWDPSLLFVMGGAVAVYFVLHRLILGRRAPLWARQFALPARGTIDARLLAGAAIFGVGWGLGGFCPGPALTALASGAGGPVTFVLAMAAGMYLFMLLQELRLTAPRAAAPAQADS